MSIYVYTMRSRKVKIAFQGKDHQANLMLYTSNMMHNQAWADADQKRRKQLYDHRLEVAQEMADKPRSGFVVLAYDDEQGIQYNSAAVYNDVAKGVYHDCDPAPGTLIGYLVKRGRRWTVEDTGGWVQGPRAQVERELFIPIRERETIDPVLKKFVRQYQTKNGEWIFNHQGAAKTYECQV